MFIFGSRMDHHRLKFLFQGLWFFTREVRSLDTNSLLTSVQDGCASFIPWINPDQTAISVASDSSVSSPKQTETTWLLYRENGTMNAHDPNLPHGKFTRQYRYLYDFATKDVIKVYLCDATNRKQDILNPRHLNLKSEQLDAFKLLALFHDLQINSKDSDNVPTSKIKDLKSQQCVHPCEADMYRGLCHILDEKSYTSLWKVTGPEKSYQIFTTYYKDM